MIEHSLIAELKDRVNIHEVIKYHGIDLKKKGSLFVSLCPFHDEKTPSFTINPQKGFYKCFGCGITGDAIQFVRDYKKLSFTDAVKELALQYNFQITNDQLANHIEDSFKEKKLLLKNISQYYQNVLHNQNTNSYSYLLLKRHFSNDTISKWQLGFAELKKNQLAPILSKSNNLQLAEELGLIYKKDRSIMEQFIDRIIFPIHNLQGDTIGFGGRIISVNSKQPKYKNSSASNVFDKSEVLYGLYQASTAIIKERNTILVEGYTDVISFHQAGLCNTVATCGTSFTEQQVNLLKKFCTRITLCRDNDAAGIQASLKDIILTLKAGLIVDIIELPEGEDPDSFILNNEHLSKEDIKKKLMSLKSDAIFWQANHLLNGSNDPGKRTESIKAISYLISLLAEEIKRNEYITQICKIHKFKTKLLLDEVNKQLQAQHNPLPKAENYDKTEYKGFYSIDSGDNIGYYFPTQNGHVKRSNFIINPLLHINNRSDDKRMLEIINCNSKKISDIPSKCLISSEQFRSIMFELPGNHVWSGSQSQLSVLLEEIGDKFETCFELKKLGWQPEGFFAYSDGIVKAGTFTPTDNKGIVEFNDRKFYSPSASEIYKNIRSDDDEYESDRYMSYRKSDITFTAWCESFYKVYKNNNAGMIGIASIVMALFRDIVYVIDNNCPLISAYGEKGSGKSKYAESLASIFNTGLPPLNLFHATDYAFSNRISRSRNTLMWFDEFNDSTIAEERFEAIKAAYDGVARERGKGGNKNKTEILKSLSSLILTGQYISSKDDNSALTRCIIIPFQRRQDNNSYSEEEISNYESLKQYEAKGLNGILVELLSYRDQFEKEYLSQFSKLFSNTRQLIKEKTVTFSERVLRNYTVLLTCMEFLSKRVSLPFTFENFQEVIIQEIIRVSSIIENTDSLADFWNTVVFLLETGKIEEGNHFKIERKISIKHSKGEIFFEKEEELLSLRLNTVHKLYAEVCRRTTGKSGMPLSSIEHYLTSSKAFIGTLKSTRFRQSDNKSMPTSCHVFKYKDIGVILDKEKE